MTNVKTLRKQVAQDALLNALSSAYYFIADQDNLDDDRKERLMKDMDVQRNRIEKLFGYEPNPQRPW
jgi:hypothetical protein